MKCDDHKHGQHSDDYEEREFIKRKYYTCELCRTLLCNNMKNIAHHREKCSKYIVDSYPSLYENLY